MTIEPQQAPIEEGQPAGQISSQTGPASDKGKEKQKKKAQTTSTGAMQQELKHYTEHSRQRQESSREEVRWGRNEMLLNADRRGLTSFDHMGIKKLSSWVVRSMKN
ncbi:hypothetical protein AC579_3290 [Pseudocercospora musae]|uniref:Uncharacterized protein n=1 Tax=Pseudocercospora musae TaxID=113226 RepID=A0A139IDJ5_9PEZI|nr:hypothetical protein AC579_3290 [Pseudocercospora musae]